MKKFLMGIALAVFAASMCGCAPVRDYYNKKADEVEGMGQHPELDQNTQESVDVIKAHSVTAKPGDIP